MFRKLAALILGIILVSVTALAFPGKSLTPNPANANSLMLIDYVSNESDLQKVAVLDEARQLIVSFNAWRVAQGINAPNIGTYPVHPGSYNIGLQEGFWTGSFQTLPVGINYGWAIPVVQCAIAPCAKPVWLANYNGYWTTNGTNPDADFTWANVRNSQHAWTLELSTANQQLCTVDESKRLTNDSGLHVSGREFSINPYNWAGATADQKFSWINRCLLIALNVPLESVDSSVVSLMHTIGPSTVSTIPSRNRTQLINAWTGTVPASHYGATLPANMAPVP